MKDIITKLHDLDEKKIICNVHRCRAGWGIIFYYPEKVKGTDFKEGLSVDNYYSSFEKCIEEEWKKLGKTK